MNNPHNIIKVTIGGLDEGEIKRVNRTMGNKVISVRKKNRLLENFMGITEKPQILLLPF